MTPTEFEILTQRLLSQRLREQLHRDIPVAHQLDFTSLSGNTYNIDVSFTYELLGLHHLVVVECKHWNSSVTREKVAAFHSVLEDLNAQKGILVSSGEFQSGAISYAQSKSIGLIKIVNGEIGDVLSHFDGGLAKIGKQLLSDEMLIPNGNYGGVGLFFPKTDPYHFIATRYGRELAYFLQNEYTPESLDDSPLKIDPVVTKQLLKVPEEWHKEYDLLETAGLGYNLANELDIRALSMAIGMLKTCL